MAPGLDQPTPEGPITRTRRRTRTSSERTTEPEATGLTGVSGALGAVVIVASLMRSKLADFAGTDGLMSRVTCAGGLWVRFAGQASGEGADLFEALQEQVETVPSAGEKCVACGGGEGERGLSPVPRKDGNTLRRLSFVTACLVAAGAVTTLAA